ncbi:hypothetical protein RRF57_008115 [Xylaria bambusicola]|uniref:Uncharacterized protein n=1 Tax=Xylaria bambusicola TaxID=326684 RepID=A0AAN7UTC4_9PEZI
MAKHIINTDLPGFLLISRELPEQRRIVAYLLKGHLGQRAPDLPGPRLERLALNVGLQDDVLEHVLLALASRDLDAALGVVVPRDALHARDGDDGLLDQPHAAALARGRRLVHAAEIGEARVPQRVLIAD